MTDAISNPTMIRMSDTDRVIADPVEDLRGRKVVDSDGEELGKVADLLIDDAANHVRFLVVEHGGILGIGASQSFLPVEMISDYSEAEVYVGTDAQTVAAAPEYDPEIAMPTSYYENVYGYYGYSPYWTLEAETKSPWYRNAPRA